MHQHGFSPHTRGCSYPRQYKKSLLGVFPAYAGMFLSIARFKSISWCFPRIRGDVPTLIHTLACLRTFSPHTRGCSVVQIRFECLKIRFPRIRGDVPPTLSVTSQSMWFSPHTRGCSADAIGDKPVDVVFPAYAGMFLENLPVKVITTSFPRIRGDVPEFDL